MTDPDPDQEFKQAIEAAWQAITPDEDQELLANLCTLPPEELAAREHEALAAVAHSMHVHATCVALRRRQAKGAQPHV